MLESFKVAIINTLLIVMILPILGFILNTIENKVAKLLSKIIGVKATIFVLNKLTFIGTVHHELSHALFVICTGAKLTSMELFKPDKRTGTLGKVTFRPREHWLIKAIQMCLISIAPMICGSLSIYLLIMLIIANSITGVTLGILIYVIISILLHMEMSKQDIINCKKGAPICIGILLLIIWILKFNSLALVSTLW